MREHWTMKVERGFVALLRLFLRVFWVVLVAIGSTLAVGYVAHMLWFYLQRGWSWFS